eukprot:9737910-Lingulodinium_polyedra.AAC.1
MGAVLGMDSVTTGKQLVISDAKDWTVLPRARILLSTIPFVPEEVPFMREVPWEDGRRPRYLDSNLEPMMRAQGPRTTLE